MDRSGKKGGSRRGLRERSQNSMDNGEVAEVVLVMKVGDEENKKSTKSSRRRCH